MTVETTSPPVKVRMVVLESGKSISPELESNINSLVSSRVTPLIVKK
ncbi:hypothetical protein [Bacillus sp. SM2101]|nr:hypothetical protein [Bacillus sp. SM2101]